MSSRFIHLEVLEEVQRARSRYPDSDLAARVDGFAQEAGEALQALIKLKHGIGDPGHARLEVIQCAGQCFRLLDEVLNG